MTISSLFAAARRKAPAIVLTITASAAVTAPAVAAFSAPATAAAPAAMMLDHPSQPSMMLD